MTLESTNHFGIKVDSMFIILNTIKNRLLGLFSFTLFFAPTFVQAETVSVLILEGKCGSVLINGKSDDSCMGVLGNSVFDNGQVLFAFTLVKNDKASMLKFFGNGEHKVATGENERIQQISTVEYVTPQGRVSYAAVGQCKYQNPYMGVPVAILCNTETKAGVMRAAFITNGEEPISE